ncbi:hypothetical protein [Longispora urticae]
MLKVTPAQRKELGDKIVSFISSYGPGSIDAALFVDDEGSFGFSAGPEVPAGCRLIMNRAGIDRLMVMHVYTLPDLNRPDGRDAFAELVSENAWLT